MAGILNGYGQVPAPGALRSSGASQVDLYVATTGADTSPGTIAAPLATLGEAVRRANVYVKIGTGGVVIHVASGTYDWTEALEPALLSGSITIIGDGAGQGADDGFVELVADTAATGGSTTSLIVAGGLGIDTYRGKTIEILTGAAASDRRTIPTHTDTTVTPAEAFTAAIVAGATFRIVESGIVIRLPNQPVTSGSTTSGMATLAHGDGYYAPEPGGYGFKLYPRQGSVFFVNVRFTSAAGASTCIAGIAGAEVICAGVELDPAAATLLITQGGTLLCGMDWDTAPSTFDLPRRLGFAPNGTAWRGWGLMDTSGGLVFWEGVRALCGYITTTSGVLLDSGYWRLFGGGMFNASRPALRMFNRARCLIMDQSINFLITAVGSTTSHTAVECADEAHLVLQRVSVTITTAGIALVAGTASTPQVGAGPGVISLGSDVTLSGPRIAAAVQNGGRIFYRANPTVAVVPTVAESAVIQGALSGAPVASGAFSALAAGAALTNPGQADGSMLMRV